MHPLRPATRMNPPTLFASRRWGNRRATVLSIITLAWPSKFLAIEVRYHIWCHFSWPSASLEWMAAIGIPSKKAVEFSPSYKYTEASWKRLKCRFFLKNSQETQVVTDHPNKHIREAIRYAESTGWTVTKSGPRSHIWGTLWCQEHGLEGCRIRIMSTPRNPENHSRDTTRGLDRCPHL